MREQLWSLIGRNRLSELGRKPEPLKKLGLVLVGIDRLAREPRPTERSSSYAILHALVQNVAGEFVLKRLDHELGVCSRLGLGHLGGECLRPLCRCLVRLPRCLPPRPFSWFRRAW